LAQLLPHIQEIAMGNAAAVASLAVFAAVLACIITERIHFTIAAMLGAMVLLFLNVLTLAEAVDYIAQSYGTLALFFGVMVMVRAFEPTKIFEYLATQMVLLARGQGESGYCWGLWQSPPRSARCCPMPLR
jgi:Na+/H+ antiporter NhaD/arsenite permease-like protein